MLVHRSVVDIAHDVCDLRTMGTQTEHNQVGELLLALRWSADINRWEWLSLESIEYPTWKRGIRQPSAECC